MKEQQFIGRDGMAQSAKVAIVTGSATGESSRRAAGNDSPGADQSVTAARAAFAADTWFSG